MLQEFSSCLYKDYFTGPKRSRFMSAHQPASSALYSSLGFVVHLMSCFCHKLKEGEKGIESRTVFSASNSVFYGCIWNWYVFNGVILIAVQSRQNSLWFQRDPMFSLASPTSSILLELSFFSSLLFPKLWIHYFLPSTVLIFSVCTVTSCILFASYQFPNMPDRDGV